MTMMQFFRDGTVTRRRSGVRRVNWPVFWTGQFWWLMETAHYGWNLTPQSDAEMICDGIFVLIVALAWLPLPISVNSGRIDA